MLNLPSSISLFSPSNLLVEQEKANCYSPPMATIKDIRRGNLLSLLDKFGTQAAIARAIEVEPAYVSALLSGPPTGREIGDKTARKIETSFGLERGWMDQVHPGTDSRPKVARLKIAGNSGLSSSVHVTELLARYDDVAVVDIPRLEVRASMGSGALRPGQDAIVGTMQLNSEWVRRNLPDISSPANLRIITGYGDSMDPTFRDGDPLIVDTGVHEVRIDAVYVFALDDELYIKTLQRMPSKGVRVISDNKKYEPYVLDEATRESLEILGRVVWAWNGWKL